MESQNNTGKTKNRDTLTWVFIDNLQLVCIVVNMCNFINF